MNNWILVADRLPESGEKVLVGVHNTNSFNGHEFYHVEISLYCCCRGWLNTKNISFICIVTHWMPLPEVPKLLKIEHKEIPRIFNCCWSRLGRHKNDESCDKWAFYNNKSK